MTDPKYSHNVKQKKYFQDTPPSLMETDVVDSMLDSPSTSRAIDMMDLDPNMMDEPYDSGFLQSSAPIPIRYVFHPRRIKHLSVSVAFQYRHFL